MNALKHSGQLNRLTGWGLLVAGLVGAAAIDPWIISEPDPTVYRESLRPLVRHAQGVTLAMAFLQLAMAYVLASQSFSGQVGRLAEWLSAVGAVLYSLGYGLGIFWHPWLLAVVVGSALNLTAFAMLALVGPSGEHSRDLRLGLFVVCFGMSLDLFSALATTQPDLFLPDYLGEADGLRLRMLRLARVAAIALCVLTLLYQQLADQQKPRRQLTDWGGFLMLCGAVGMPAALTLASLLWTNFKYLSMIPATTTMIGVTIALVIAWRQRCVLERAGWTMIVASLGAGAVMGCYSFDGPLPTPEFLGEYGEFARRVVRLAHSYSIVVGMLAIFTARSLPATSARSPRQTRGAVLVVCGGVVTVVAMFLQAFGVGPTAALTVGPIVAVTGVLVCLPSWGSS